MARPKSDNPLVGVQGRIYQDDIAYLELWGKEQGLALREVITRCRKMWPKGPFSAGGKKKRHTRPIVTSRLKAYAAAQGIEPKEAAAVIVSQFLDKQTP